MDQGIGWFEQSSDLDGEEDGLGLGSVLVPVAHAKT